MISRRTPPSEALPLRATRSSENFTSGAVTSVPSENVAPARSGNVHTVDAASVVGPLDSEGTAWSVAGSIAVNESNNRSVATIADWLVGTTSAGSSESMGRMPRRSVVAGAGSAGALVPVPGSGAGAGSSDDEHAAASETTQLSAAPARAAADGADGSGHARPGGARCRGRCRSGRSRHPPEHRRRPEVPVKPDRASTPGRWW